MDPLRRGDRIQDPCLPRRRTAAPDMETCRHSRRILAQNHRDTGSARCVLRLPDADPRKRLQRDFPDLCVRALKRTC